MFQNTNQMNKTQPTQKSKQQGGHAQSKPGHFFQFGDPRFGSLFLGTKHVDFFTKKVEAQQKSVRDLTKKY